MLGTATSKLTVLGLYVFRTQSNCIHIRVPAILQMFCIHHVQDMERFMESVAGSAILPDSDHVRSFLCLRHEPREDEIDGGLVTSCHARLVCSIAATQGKYGLQITR